MTKRRARIYDALMALVIIIIVGIDQWTKAQVIEHLSPPDSGPQIHLIGQYLVLLYTRNNGMAFTLFTNSIILIVLILVAIVIISSLYVRILNTGSLPLKLFFGLIMGGALGNLISRAQHGGYVIDFIAFRIPQIGFYFAIFNIADAAICIGACLFLVIVLSGNLRHAPATT